MRKAKRPIVGMLALTLAAALAPAAPAAAHHPGECGLLDHLEAITAQVRAFIAGWPAIEARTGKLSFRQDQRVDVTQKIGVEGSPGGDALPEDPESPPDPNAPPGP